MITQRYELIIAKQKLMRKPLLFSKGVVFNWFNKYEWHVASRDKECYNLYEKFLLIEALYSRKTISYRTNLYDQYILYTGIKMVVFCIGLNTSHAGLVLAILGYISGFGRKLDTRSKRKKKNVDLTHSNLEILFLTPIFDLFILASHSW